jgi:hypothetical protein
VHVAALLLWRLLDRGEVAEVLVEAVEQRPAALGVGLFAAAEHDRHLDLVLLVEEALDVTLLRLVVVVGDLRAQLDLADVDLLLVLARLLGLLLLLVLVLRVVEQAAYGRRASSVSTTPICSPSAPIRRTFGTRMRSLMRVGSRSGGRRSKRRGTGTRRRA